MNEERYVPVNQTGLELVFDGDPNWHRISNHIGMLRTCDPDNGKVLLEYGVGDDALIDCRNLISAYITGLILYRNPSFSEDI